MSEPLARPADPILSEVRAFYESHNDGIERSRRSHHYYYDCLTRILRVRVPPGERVLDLGCGAGATTAQLAATPPRGPSPSASASGR